MARKSLTCDAPGMTATGECGFCAVRMPMRCHGSIVPCVLKTLVTLGRNAPYSAFLRWICSSMVSLVKLKSIDRKLKMQNSNKIKCSQKSLLTVLHTHECTIPNTKRRGNSSRMVVGRNRTFDTNRIRNTFDRAIGGCHCAMPVHPNFHSPRNQCCR